MKKILFFYLVLAIFAFTLIGCNQNFDKVGLKEHEEGEINLNIAVEYTDHAAAFYYAQGKNLFLEKGININDVKVYASGVGVASAFTKGGFDASYMCLVPAIFTYANGGVPIKIIAGTHKNGYGLVVNNNIKKLEDLEKSGVKIANGPQGTSTDFLQMLLMEKENLDSEKILAQTVRMNAAKQLMALHNNRVDAVFVPEHFASLAASFPGMKMLIKSTDIWPDMQGSVLVVTDELLKKRPDMVMKLREVNQESILLMNENPLEAAEIVAQSLNINQGQIKEETSSPEADLEVTTQLALVSIDNMKMSADISIQEVQAVIDKMFDLGYLQKSFAAQEIMVID